MMATVYDGFINDLTTEIGNQTLQRFGLNIFNINTYNAYGTSVDLTNEAFRVYEQRKKAEKTRHGFTFEVLEAGAHNIQYAKSDQKLKNFRTDDIGKTNDEYTDRVTLSVRGNELSSSQDKAVINTNELLKDKYLKNDYITVPKDDYERHEKELKKIAQNAKYPADRRELAKNVLKKLKSGNFTREEAENSRKTAIKIQGAEAVIHLATTTASDGIMQALSTLASGFIYETRFYYSGKSNESIWQHLQRLLKKTLESFKNGLAKGSSFAGIDIIISTISGIFKGFLSNLANIWGKLRSSFKSIYNGIYEYITGKIKTKRELFTIIIKSLSSALAVFGIVLFEAKLKLYVGDLLATAISVIIGSMVVVSIPKLVDYMLGCFNAAELSKKRAEEIAKLCDTELPLIIEAQEKLSQEINIFFNDRVSCLDKSFAELSISFENSNIDMACDSLNQINKLYGKSLPWRNNSEMDDFMLSDEPLEL